MPTDIPALNPPPATQVSSATAYKHHVRHMTLTADQRQIVYIPPMVNFRPIVLQFSTLTGLVVESTIATGDSLNGVGGSPAVQWFTETVPATKFVITHPVTALRITCSGALECDILA